MRELDIDPHAKALIFDLDGTIADTMPLHYAAYRKILKDYGIDFPSELFYALAGIPAIETMEILNSKYGKSMDADEIGWRKENEYESLMPQMEPIKPVVKVIKRHYGKLPMAVGTGAYKDLAWKTLEILDLKTYFEIVITNEDVSNFKPHPDTFLKCADLMGVDPQFCQVFEDSELGIEAAQKAGMMYINVREYYEVKI